MPPANFPTFGLQLTDTMLRLIECARKGKTFELKRAYRAPLPTRSIQNGILLNPQSLTLTIKEAYASAKPKTRFVSFSLPERHTFLKLLNVPAANTAQSGDAILWEATQHFPLSPEDAYYDWERVPGTNRTIRPYLVAAAPKPLVNEYVALFDGTKIIPTVLEPESLSIWRALSLAVDPTMPLLIVYLGNRYATLIVSDARTVQFAATDTFSGTTMTATIAAELDLPPRDAEKAKQLFGLDPRKGKGTTKRALEIPLLAFCKKLQTIATYYQGHFPEGRAVRNIILAGPNGYLPGLKEFIANVMHLPVETVDPFQMIRIPLPLQEALGTDPYGWTTVLGASLRDLL